MTRIEIDRDMFREETVEEVKQKLDDDKIEDLEGLITVLTEITDDLANTFDACLAQHPPRKDIIEVYMEISHVQICKRLTDEWEKNALKMNSIETLSLLDWL